MHRTFDYRPHFDERSRDYPIRAVVGEVPEQRRTWHTGPVLDQGAEGACVGFGWTGELMASPRPDRTATAEVGNAYARRLYETAKTLDEWPGENYEGTSVLAGAKAVQAAGFMGEYRWAFSIEDVRDAIITTGPVVIGINWLSGMYETDEYGAVQVEGSEVGGHCLYVPDYHPWKRLPSWHTAQPAFRWRNSWGDSYGIGGSGWIKYDDLAELLSGGEACVPLQRNRVRLETQP